MYGVGMLVNIYQSRLYFFIVAQIAQGGQPMLVKWARQLLQSVQQ